MKVLGILVLLSAGLFMARAIRILWIISKIPSRPALVKRYGGLLTLRKKACRRVAMFIILALLGSVLLFQSCAPPSAGLFSRCKFKKKLE